MLAGKHHQLPATALPTFWSKNLAISLNASAASGVSWYMIQWVETAIFIVSRKIEELKRRHEERCGQNLNDVD
jgi:hypothetical protein